MRIYLASSWRNPFYDTVLSFLRSRSHDVYDFKEDGGAFHWREVDPDYQYGHLCQGSKLLTLLDHPLAKEGFKADMNALRNCEVCVLLLPCGRSAHLEAGWARGAGKRLYVLAREDKAPLYEPELMYSMSDEIVTSIYDLERRLV